MKILCIGDPHFKVNNILESDDMTTKLISITKTIKPDFIVVLGDILHRHEKIHVSPLMRAEKLVRLLSEISPVYVIIGNHDRPNNSTWMTDEHPFNALKLWPNTYVVDSNVVDSNVINNSGNNSGNKITKEYRFLFVPYVFPGKFMETLNHPDKGVVDPLNGTTAIFCHQEFYGAKMGAIESRAGDRWDVNYPLVISGHVHDYDRLQENLIYVGTPMQHAFGDSSDKTVSLFTFDNTNEKKWEESRIDLGLTKRIIVYLTPDKFHTYEPPTDKLVKIVVQGDDASVKATSKLEKVKELRKKGVMVVFKVKKVDNDSNNLNNKVGIKLRMRYRDRLYTAIRSDSKQLEWFNKVFK